MSTLRDCLSRRSLVTLRSISQSLALSLCLQLQTQISGLTEKTLIACEVFSVMSCLDDTAELKKAKIYGQTDWFTAFWTNINIAR